MTTLLVIFLTFVACPLAVIGNPTSANNPRPTVKIDSGVVVGITKTDNTSGLQLNAFLGIPFAAPPVRWGPPQRPAPWTAPFSASKYGPACVQQFNYPLSRRNLILQWFNTPPPPAGESEDCLNLCVYAPLPNGKEKPQPKAVMVWLYGGGLLYGSNSQRLYDGSNLAASQDVVVVVVNYRTNVFGFPASPQIPVTENNPGWLDQRFALDWVRRNIAAFGGDPGKVTIFGESAGAESVDALITQPPKPLSFRAAIMESGTATFRGRPADPFASWNILVAAMNCSSATDILACMRSIPATTIKTYNEMNRMPWIPVFDNVTSADTARSNRLSSTPQKSKIARVPILGGTNADEGRLYSVTANDSASFIRVLFPTATDQQVSSLLAAYPIAPAGVGFGNKLEQLGAVYTDVIFQCPARLVHLETAQVGIPSYRYYYNASFANTDLFPDAGVYHSSEIGIVMGTYPATNATAFQRRLSRYVQKVWADFAKDPYYNSSSPSTPPWPQVPAAMGMLGGGVRAEDGPDAKGANLTVLNRNQTDVIDQRCALYQAFYDALGH
ncbi:uncharacterized protein A1O5_10559 [Cladophialophora psammophila CBS 110553]|uniref:Carboxylic ester hydrolase n=1 Tax=Cladophialophora psammophila CBS 110553 TaxID=1182543 RepID=W9WE80_9EURO|nr:uncharacterized protein A1O5_10559 [Cladophialophora psammophila CBS 110553]EXJ66407.1 hypothetical protein A1O5_10559 [Cladophialophora psammophila CBS 110553]